MYIAKLLFASIIAASFVVGCSREEKSGDPWTKRCTLAQPKGHNEYDVIIAGGGFGGLSCGSMLAAHGYKVLLLDKNPEVGGLCSSDTKEGFLFNYGAEDIGGIWDRGAVSYLLNELQLSQQQLFALNVRRFFVENTALDTSQPPNCIEKALSDMFPQFSVQVHEFLTAARKVYLQAYDEEMISRWGIILPKDLWKSKMPQRWSKEYERQHELLLAWEKKTFQEVLDEYFQDQQIKNIFCGLISYFGTPPYKTPASEIVVKTFGYFFFGGYRALGTPQRFAAVLADSIKAHGGTVLCNQRVSKIVTGKNGVRGVQAGDQVFFAPVVVSNINAKTLYSDLVDPTILPEGFLENVQSIPMGNSVLALQLGVDADLSSYPTLVQDRDNQTFVAILSNKDASVAPKGKAAVVVREFARYADFFGADKEYVRQREQALLARGADLVPELNTSVVVSRLITPVEYEALVAVPLGSVYGFSPTSNKSLSFRTPIPGLYLCGATCGGPGVESVIRNGILCFQDILGWENTQE
jgi:all-trans-retinol 13,14-reductase